MGIIAPGAGCLPRRALTLVVGASVFGMIPVESFSREMAQLAAKVDADAPRAGKMIPFADLLIGATDCSAPGQPDQPGTSKLMKRKLFETAPSRPRGKQIESLRTTPSTLASACICLNGGRDRTRTCDLLRVKQAL